MAKKVLVVDDEKLIVKGIRFSLEQDGMEVDCAYDGEEALKMATENTYDMILLDIMLPKMNGFEVCQQIREFSDVPIIMLTAKADDMDKLLGFEHGGGLLPGTEHFMQPGRVLALPYIDFQADFSIHLADLDPVVVLQGKQGVHEPHIGVYVRDGEGLGRDIQYLG